MLLYQLVSSLIIIHISNILIIVMLSLKPHKQNRLGTRTKLLIFIIIVFCAFTSRKTTNVAWSGDPVCEDKV